MFYNISRTLDNGSRLVGKHMMGNTFMIPLSNKDSKLSTFPNKGLVL